MKPVTTKLRGQALLREPLLNKGTAFSLEERAQLGLNGLLPPQVKSLEQQQERAHGQYRRQPDDLAKNVYLTALHDRNEVLFYRLLTDHLPEMLPIVYTPTVALAIERYSHQYRRPRGVFLSIDNPELLEELFGNTGLASRDVDLIVATDGERILGIGDWGVGGIDISIGKLDLYTAASGIDPTRVIPVILDVGTDRRELLEDPQYLGNRHPRVRGEAYDAFVDHYVSTASRLFPDALLHWEDFGAENARRILLRYRESHRTFNDDMQGTGAVVLAASLGAMSVLGHRLRDQRVVMFGAGTAGIGIADQLRDAMVREGLPVSDAMRRFWCVGRHGLCTTDMASSLRDFQLPYARRAEETHGWSKNESGGYGLAEVVRQVKPTILIGTSTVAGAFTEAIVREMAAQVERPIIFPLTNPTSQSEAVPADLVAWTSGRALIATGSPFPPVTYGGKTYAIAQANNALVFPGLGLGTIVTRARTVSDAMLATAASAVASQVHPSAAGAAILPEMDDLRTLSAAVAGAVARAAIEEGLAGMRLSDVEGEIRRAMWQPVYRPIVAG